MKESYGKGLASHPGPESCVRGGNAAGEALTGEHAGQLLSCEINYFRGPTSLTEAEGNTADGVSASHRRPLRSRRPCACVEAPRAEPGRSYRCPSNGGAGRSGKASGRNPDMHACGKSDGRIVPRKRANNARSSWHGRNLVTLADERASQP
jgi:hypothetical protein